MSNDNSAERLKDILAEQDFGMLVSRELNGSLHSRPMAVAGIEDEDVFFATSLHSVKVDEIRNNNSVVVTFQDGRRFISLEGAAEINSDPALKDRMWSDSLKIWFPKGKDDPELCFLRVRASEGEFWDTSGAKGLKYVFQAAKALVTGTKPAIDEKQHGKTNF